jgi:hypothetical protein
LLHLTARTENFSGILGDGNSSFIWRCPHMMWVCVYSSLTVLLALPGAVVGILTLVEQYHKRRADHAKK